MRARFHCRLAINWGSRGSQLWNAFHSPEDVEPALDETLTRLGTSYLDMYLIHWLVL